MIARPTAVIADVDGTLVDVESVLHHLLARPKNFAAFHRGAISCPPHTHALDWCRAQHRAGHEILVVTARMRQWHAVTKNWLDAHVDVPFRGPFMRADGDHRQDTVVKREIFAHLSTGFDIVAAIEDRPRIVELWRELGLAVEAMPDTAYRDVDLVAGAPS